MEDQERSSTSLGAKLDSEVLEARVCGEPAPSHRISMQSFHNNGSKLGSGLWENQGAKLFDGDRDEPDPSFEDEDNLADANGIQANNADKEVVAEQVVRLSNHYETVGFIIMENDSQPESAKEKKTHVKLSRAISLERYREHAQ